MVFLAPTLVEWTPISSSSSKLDASTERPTSSREVISKGRRHARLGERDRLDALRRLASLEL
jgi:hypothetical protein